MSFLLIEIVKLLNALQIKRCLSRPGWKSLCSPSILWSSLFSPFHPSSLRRWKTVWRPSGHKCQLSMLGHLAKIVTSGLWRRCLVAWAQYTQSLLFLKLTGAFGSHPGLGLMKIKEEEESDTPGVRVWVSALSKCHFTCNDGKPLPLSDSFGIPSKVYCHVQNSNKCLKLKTFPPLRCGGGGNAGGGWGWMSILCLSLLHRYWLIPVALPLNDIYWGQEKKIQPVCQVSVSNWLNCWLLGIC